MCKMWHPSVPWRVLSMRMMAFRWQRLQGRSVPTACWITLRPMAVMSLVWSGHLLLSQPEAVWMSGTSSRTAAKRTPSGGPTPFFPRCIMSAPPGILPPVIYGLRSCSRSAVRAQRARDSNSRQPALETKPQSLRAGKLHPALKTSH